MLDPTDYSFLKTIKLTYENTKDLALLSHPMPEGVVLRQIWHRDNYLQGENGPEPLNWFTFLIYVPLATGEHGIISGIGCAAVPCLTEPEQKWNVVSTQYSHGQTELWLNNRDPDVAKLIETTGIRENVQKYTNYCMQVAKEYAVHAFAEANEKHIRDQTEHLTEVGELLSQSLKF